MSMEANVNTWLQNDISVFPGSGFFKNICGEHAFSGFLATENTNEPAHEIMVLMT